MKTYINNDIIVPNYQEEENKELVLPFETKTANLNDPYANTPTTSEEEIKSFLLTGQKTENFERKSMQTTIGAYKSGDNNKICLPHFSSQNTLKNKLPFAEHRINASRVSIQYPTTCPQIGTFSAKELAKSTQESMEKLNGVEIEQVNLEWLYNCSFQKISLLDSEHTAKSIIDENIAACQAQEEALILFGDSKKQFNKMAKNCKLIFKAFVVFNRTK